VLRNNLLLVFKTCANTLYTYEQW